MGKFPVVAPPGSHSRSQYRDANGELILEIGFSEYIVTNPDHSVEQHKVGSSIELMCGTQWSPWTQPAIPVGVCADCRQPRFAGFRRRLPRHGLVALARARLCSNCGRLCCPTRATRSDADGKWRCQACGRAHTRRSLLGRMLKAILLVETED